MKNKKNILALTFSLILSLVIIAFAREIVENKWLGLATLTLLLSSYFLFRQGMFKGKRLAPLWALLLIFGSLIIVYEFRQDLRPIIDRNADTQASSSEIPPYFTTLAAS